MAGPSVAWSDQTIGAELHQKRQIADGTFDYEAFGPGIGWLNDNARKLLE